MQEAKGLDHPEPWADRALRVIFMRLRIAKVH
jgi:hypothetical protein